MSEPAAIPVFKPCVVIPAYNHHRALPQKVAHIVALGLPCILVNDGSTDQTGAVIDSLAAQHAEVIAIHRASNGGKGAAVKTGLRAAFGQGYSHALQIDADDQHQLDDIPHFLQLSAAQPQALIAGYPQYDASLPSSRKYARYITHFWVWLETLSFTAVKDSMCGFRVYPLRETMALLDAQSIGNRMDFDIDIIVKLYWRGVTVVNTPTRVRYPADGSSHFQLWRDNLRISALHARLFLSMLLLQLPLRLWRKLTGGGDAHWSQTRERGSHFWLSRSVALYRKCGRPLGLVIAYGATAYFFLTGRAARAASRNYLQTLYAWSGGRSPKPSLANSARQFCNLAICVLDRFGCWFGDLRREQFDCTASEVFVAQSQSGRGAVLFCSHLGNAEIASLLAEGLPNVFLNVLVHTRHAQQLNDLLASAGTRQQCRFLQVEDVGVETAILLREKIAHGEWVVIACDRTPVSGRARTVVLPFLGRPAAFAQGPFILAALLECPVYTLFCLRERGGYRVEVELFSQSLKAPRRERDASLLAAQQRYVAKLESMVLRYPLQWFNFFDYWADVDAH